MEKKRLVYLDVLRVLSVIPVLMCHYMDTLSAYGIQVPRKLMPNPLFSVYLGNVGVAVFFIISGAALMYTYKGPLDLKHYFKRRFIGIYPMFWIAYLAAFFYYFYKNAGWTLTNSRSYIIYTILGIDGYFHNWIEPNFYLLGEWFLGCLILLYLLFPLLKWGLEKNRKIMGIVIVILWVIGVTFYDWKIPAENFFLFRIPEFLFGMWFVGYGKKSNWLAALAGAAILIVFSFTDVSWISVVYRDTAIGISIFIIVAWVCDHIHGERFFGLCKTIGGYGYAVFLCHHVIVNELLLHFAEKQVLSGTENILLFVLYLMLTAFFANLLVRFNRSVTAKIFH